MPAVDQDRGDATGHLGERGGIVGAVLEGGDRVVRVAPPLNISEAELAAGLAALEQALQDTA